METPLTFDKKDVEENRVVSAIGYLWILFLVPLLLRKNSPYAQAHAKQALVLFIVQAISSLVVWVPIAGQLWNFLVVLLVPLVALVRTLHGTYWSIPIVDGYARKISFD